MYGSQFLSCYGTLVKAASGAGSGAGKRPLVGSLLLAPIKKPRQLDAIPMADIQGDVLADVPLISMKGGSMVLKIMTQNKARANKQISTSSVPPLVLS